jgi:hypothetical protein
MWIFVTREGQNLFTYGSGTFSIGVETYVGVEHPMKVLGPLSTSFIKQFGYLYFEMVEGRLRLSCPEHMRDSFDEMKADTSSFYKKTSTETSVEETTHAPTTHVPMSDPGTICTTMDDRMDKVFKLTERLKHHKGDQVVTDIVKDNIIELLVGIVDELKDNQPRLIDIFKTKI